MRKLMSNWKSDLVGIMGIIHLADKFSCREYLWNYFLFYGDASIG
jgi:hypothetical protein